MRVRIATSSQDMRTVWRITHDAYVSQGYAKPTPNGMLRHYPTFDGIDETVVFVAETRDKEIIGTVSYTLDGVHGLPMDDEFKPEIDEIRSHNKWLSGCWRLATVGHCRATKKVLLALMAAAVDSVKHSSELILFTFNPKHQAFYERFGLVAIAGPKAAAAVDGHPSVLMMGERDDLAKMWKAR